MTRSANDTGAKNDVGADVAGGIAIWDRFPPTQRMVINYTLTCNLACDHCIVESNPTRRERLTLDEVRSVLEQGQRTGKRHVTFRGGEVFLYPQVMCQAIAHGVRLGYVVDVESNAFWARNPAQAEARLRPFVEAGIHGLSLSADVHHMRYFPVERPINAARAARASGLATEIQFCTSADEQADEQIRAALIAAGEPFVVLELLDRGRAREMHRIWRGRPVTELPDCDDLTTTVHATGDAYACCQLDIGVDDMKRTPVFLGPVRGPGSDPAEQARRERLVHAFHDPQSPAYFRTMVAEDPQFQDLADARFTNICDFCLRALSDPARVAALERVLARAGRTAC